MAPATFTRNNDAVVLEFDDNVTIEQPSFVVYDGAGCNPILRIEPDPHGPGLMLSRVGSASAPAPRSETFILASNRDYALHNENATDAAGGVGGGSTTEASPGGQNPAETTPAPPGSENQPASTDGGGQGGQNPTGQPSGESAAPGS